MKFGDILRNLIDEKGLTQRQLAVDLNMASSTLGNYIRSLREPDYDTLKKFASYFGVSTDYLLDFRTKQTATHMEDEILRIFRELSRDQQELYLEQGKAIVNQNIKKEKSSDSKPRKNKTAG